MNALRKTISIFMHFSAVFLLMLATCLCLINCTNQTGSTQPHDPVFGIPLNLLFWIVCGFSWMAALTCLFGDSLALPAFLLLWLAFSYLAYRIGLYWVGCRTLTGFLGGFNYAFGISPVLANLMA